MRKPKFRRLRTRSAEWSMMVTLAAAGEQHLRGDLAEAREADHQHVGPGALEILVQLLSCWLSIRRRLESVAPSGVIAIDSVTMAISSEAVLERQGWPAMRRPLKQHEGELAALRQQEGDAHASSWLQPNSRQSA